MELIEKVDYFKALDWFSNHTKKSALLKVLASGPSTYNSKRLKKEFKLLKQSIPLNDSKNSGKLLFNTQKYTAVQSRQPIDFFPEELHKAHQHQTYLYKVMNNLHPQLETASAKDRFKFCQAIVNASDEIKIIYELLDYWRDNKIILPNKYLSTPPEEFRTIAQLVNRKNTLRTYISKLKGRPEKAVKLKDYKIELKAVEFKINSHE